MQVVEEVLVDQRVLAQEVMVDQVVEEDLVH